MLIENGNIITVTGATIPIDGRSVQLDCSVNENGEKVFMVCDGTGRDLSTMLSGQELLALSVFMGKLWNEYKDVLIGKAREPRKMEPGENSDDNFVFKGTVLGETEKAYKVETVDDTFWIPKSQAHATRLEENFYEFIIPEWLAIKKELM